MGTDVHVIVVVDEASPPGLAEDLGDRAFVRLEQLEARWSRFRPDSELNRLNAAGGAPVMVAPITFELLQHAVHAWQRTDGACDPTVAPAVVAAGYDRDFGTVPADGPALDAGPVGPAPGCAGIVLDPIVRSVRLPADVTLDLGGVAKGFAADVVADELAAAGAVGVCVNLGGDLRVIGTPPRGDGADGWVVEVEEADDRPRLSIAAGAIATTSRRRRTWQRGEQAYHHVIDPRTGAPATGPWLAATVLTGRARDAEALAKAAFLAPDEDAASAMLTRNDATGLLVGPDGRSVPLAGIDPYRC
jgi:thiamine biosynthesis lipoprotein